jgi:hypothetical protein
MSEIRPDTGRRSVAWRPGMRRAALYGLLFLAGLLSKDGFGAMLVVVVGWTGPSAGIPRSPLRAG